MDARRTTAPTHFQEAAGHGNEPFNVARELAYLRNVMVNVFFIGPSGAGDRGWVLVDAGLPGSAGRIMRAAERRFGRSARPSCILLTHGHFDHVGSLRTLAETWDVPIYAHPLEIPYLTGRSAYPPPDPNVGGGIFSTLSVFYPKGPDDFRPWIRELPEDGSVPGLAGWRWIFTPGHSPGHVSFFRDDDRTLVAGDAFVTTKQESAVAVMTQAEEIHGPPMYFTPDWVSAADSVRKLAALEPEVAATGHGIPLRGASMRAALDHLARDFEREAVPPTGTYVRQPAITDERGIVSTPYPFPPLGLFAAVGAGVGLALGLTLRGRRRDVGSAIADQFPDGPQ